MALLAPPFPRLNYEVVYGHVSFASESPFLCGEQRVQRARQDLQEEGRQQVLLTGKPGKKEKGRGLGNHWHTVMRTHTLSKYLQHLDEGKETNKPLRRCFSPGNPLQFTMDRVFNAHAH